MDDWPISVSRRRALVADVVSRGFGFTVVISSRPRKGGCVSPVVQAQGTDGSKVETNKICADRSCSVSKELCQSKRRNAYDIRRSALNIASDDVLEDVWRFTDKSQSTLTDVEILHP